LVGGNNFRSVRRLADGLHKWALGRVVIAGVNDVPMKITCDLSATITDDDGFPHLDCAMHSYNFHPINF